MVFQGQWYSILIHASKEQASNSRPLAERRTNSHPFPIRRLIESGLSRRFIISAPRRTIQPTRSQWLRLVSPACVLHGGSSIKGLLSRTASTIRHGTPGARTTGSLDSWRLQSGNSAPWMEGAQFPISSLASLARRGRC